MSQTPEIPYGTGSIWRSDVDTPSERVLVRQEETTWRARPDVAPDGRRVIYASYLGRQWHQLWITAAGGRGEPFPLTYGDYDVSYPRWSPNGERIAFTTNETGNTQLRLIDVPGGTVTNISIAERRYLRDTGSVAVSVVDESGARVSARVSVVAADGRAYAPYDRWMHADDSFDRSKRKEEARYFHVFDETLLTIPSGKATVTVWRGFETEIERRVVDVEASEEVAVDIELRRLEMPDQWHGWRSGDVHVHMNYGGIYRNTPEYLVRQAEAEDLDLVFNLIVNKEQRVPDIRYFSGAPDAASNQNVVVQHSQEFHTGFWGHIALLNLSANLLLPDYSAYPETAAASLYPDNVTVEDMAHAQGGVAGYVHPFAYPLPDPAKDASLTSALPIDVALGKVDFYEVVGFAGHMASADIWYRLLNCGFRISAAGGTDAMANFASLRGPVGMNRTYVQSTSWPSTPAGRRDVWVSGLKAGRSIASNGPLLGLTINAAGPGSELEFEGATNVEYSGFLRSTVPLDKLELVQNGKVVREVELTGDRMRIDFSGSLRVDRSSWLILRASAKDSHPEVFDMYPYATTSPVYVNVGAVGPRSITDADYFLAWIDRVRQSAAGNNDYNSAAERDTVLANIDAAIAVFEARRLTPQ